MLSHLLIWYRRSCILISGWRISFYMLIKIHSRNNRTIGTKALSRPVRSLLTLIGCVQFIMFQNKSAQISKAHYPVGWGGGEDETRSGTEKRCSHNLKSGHPAWWSAENCSIYPTVNIFRFFRSKKQTGRGNQ